MKLKSTFGFRLGYRGQIAAFSALLLLLCAASLYWNWWRSVDRYMYDAVINAAAPAVDSRLLIVGVDEQTLAVMGRWPWPRAVQAELIAKVAQGRPAALLVDIVHSGNSAAADDAALVAALDQLDVAALPIIFDTISLRQPPVEVLPFQALLPVADVLGHVHIELDDDSISRGTYLYQGVGEAYWPHLTLALAQSLGLDPVDFAARDPALAACRQPAGFSLQNQRCGKVLIPFAGPPGTVPQLSALALMQGQVDPSLLRDKIVVLGLTASGVADWVTSPVSGRSRPISGVEYNANMLNALIQHRLILPAPQWLVWALSLAVLLAVALLLPRTTPKTMLVVVLLGASVPLLLATVALVWFSRYLPLATPAMTALIAYPLWSWRRHEVAWRFLDTELSRLQRERAELGIQGRRELALAAANGELPQLAERLASLLGAEHKSARVDLKADTADLQLVVAAPDIVWVDAQSRRHRLTREQPFTDEEAALALRLIAPSQGQPVVVEPLPGESLAAKIRLLQRQAESVEVGRDIGLQGLERMASGVCVISALGDVLFTNSALRKFVGAERATADVFTLLAPLGPPLGRTWRDIWRDVVCTGATEGFETPLVGQGHGFVYCAPLQGGLPGHSPAVLANLTDDAQTGLTWLVTVTDTTEAQVAHRAREEALAFCPMTCVHHWYPLLRWLALTKVQHPIVQAKLLMLAAVAHKRLQDIEAYAQKSLAVSEQFLQLSRLEAQTAFETYELDLLQVLDNAADQLFVQAQTADIRIDGSVLEQYDNGVWVEGNGELLERAFINLLSNAVKYSPRESDVVLLVDTTADTVSIGVEDSGVGIPEADLPQLFDPYFRSSDPKLAAQRGAGLGLRFVKTVVERHPGEAFRSQRGWRRVDLYPSVAQIDRRGCLKRLFKTVVWAIDAGCEWPPAVCGHPI